MILKQRSRTTGWIMNIRDSDLKKEYTVYCAQKTADSRKNCLSPEKLILLARGELPAKEKEDCLIHISDCVHCCWEVKEILKIIKFFFLKSPGKQQLSLLLCFFLQYHRSFSRVRS